MIQGKPLAITDLPEVAFQLPDTPLALMLGRIPPKPPVEPKPPAPRTVSSSCSTITTSGV